MKRFVFVALVASLGASSLGAQQRGGAAELGELVSGLGVTARVLMIGAHPDDEDTRLIAYLARGRHVETAYLSLTRGDGGQNLLGNELGEALGVIRTEELLAARRIDGAHQYFTRAFDFGFSKNSAEAFRHWPRDSVLGDVVTVVRAFRPHVILSVFSGTPADGHGHHQAAGILAREVYDAAADSVRFPAAKYGAPWVVSKFYRASYFARTQATLCFNVGEYSALYGESYAEMAAQSRSQHKSQAMGQIARKGAQEDCVRREATRVTAAQDPKQEKSIFDGIDTTWARLGATTLAADVAAAQRTFDLLHPEKIEPALSKIETALSEMLTGGRGSPSEQADRRRSASIAMARIARARALALGLALDATADRDLVASGDSIAATATLYNRGQSAVELGGNTTIAGDSASVERLRITGGTGYTQPWWLAKPRVGDLFGVPIDTIAEDQRPSAFTRSVAVMSSGTAIALSTPVIHRFADPVKGEIDHPLAVAPAISVTFDQQSEYAPANVAIDRELRVLVRSAATSAKTVRVSLSLPKGLTTDSSVRTVTLPSYGAARTVAFRVAGRLALGAHTISAVAESDGARFTVGYIPIEYDHIRPQRIYRDAAVIVQAVDVKLPPNLTIAYINGVGDNIAPTLQQLGLNVTVIDPAKLATVDLSRYSTIVVGTRAYESSPELVAHNSRLLDYVKRGGTMVVQYGQFEMQQPGILPYSITMSRPADRVTDENSPVSILKPDSPLLSSPNKIAPKDFEGWIQDRTVYMPHTWAPEYSTLLSTHDPDEAPNESAILVAPYGRGEYVYTTLAFFRQLPAGVPGAARLFVNLLGAKGTGQAAVVP